MESPFPAALLALVYRRLCGNWWSALLANRRQNSDGWEWTGQNEANVLAISHRVFTFALMKNTHIIIIIENIQVLWLESKSAAPAHGCVCTKTIQTHRVSFFCFVLLCFASCSSPVRSCPCVQQHDWVGQTAGICERTARNDWTTGRQVDEELGSKPLCAKCSCARCKRLKLSYNWTHTHTHTL